MNEHKISVFVMGGDMSCVPNLSKYTKSILGVTEVSSPPPDEDNSNDTQLQF